MAPRALGALLAIVAAIAFVVSVASSSWWSGHPDVAGHTITAKTVRVGLLGATGCNTGGDGRCESVEVTSGMATAGLIELLAVGVSTLLAFMLAASAWKIGERRKTLANLAIVASLLTAVGAVGVLMVGPAIHASQAVKVPIGWGTFVFFGGVVAVLAASGITRNLEVEPFRLKSSAYVPLAVPPSMREILRDQHDGLRPAQLGPEPMIGAGGPGQMIPARPSAPLIGGAPQLRPLYDPGNDGYVPAPISPPLPVAPPTPLPKSMIDQLTGKSTPQPDVHPPARSHLPSTPPPGRPQSPSVPPPVARPASASVPPPVARPNSPSVPPPVVRPNSPSAPPPPRAAGPSVPPPLRGARTSVAPPVGSREPVPAIRASTQHGHGNDAGVRVAQRSSASKLPGGSSTMAHTVPPMPEKTPAPVMARAQTEADDRLDKAMRPTDYHTAVEIDADAKAAAAAAQMGDVTETNLKIHAQSVPNTSEDSVVAPPPGLSMTSQRGDDVVSTIQPPVTLQLEVGMVLTDGDPASAKQRALAPPGLTGLTSVQSMPPSMIPAMPSRISAELAAQTDVAQGDPFADSAVQQGGPTREMAAPRVTGELAAEPLTDMLARQQHDTSDTDQQGPHGTDRTRQAHEGESLVGPTGTDVTRRPASRASQAPIATNPPRGAEHTPIPTHARPSLSTAPTNLAPPKAEEAVASGPTPGCPQCESPMAWVEEHLRFYCKQCRMYF